MWSCKWPQTTWCASIAGRSNWGRAESICLVYPHTSDTRLRSGLCFGPGRTECCSPDPMLSDSVAATVSSHFTDPVVKLGSCRLSFHRHYPHPIHSCTCLSTLSSRLRNIWWGPSSLPTPRPSFRADPGCSTCERITRAAPPCSDWKRSRLRSRVRPATRESMQGNGCFLEPSARRIRGKAPPPSLLPAQVAMATEYACPVRNLVEKIKISHCSNRRTGNWLHWICVYKVVSVCACVWMCICWFALLFICRIPSIINAVSRIEAWKDDVTPPPQCCLKSARYLFP